MTRFAAVLGLALLVGCNDTTGGGNAGLDGTQALAHVGTYLFVTAAERDELRVLDLAAPTRRWVPAPNPLLALGIPTIDRPIGFAREVRFVENELQAGQLLFVRGAVTPEIGVIDTAPSELKERFRLVAPATVTAIAARAPEVAGGTATLYVATYDGTDSKLYEVEVSEGGTESGRVAISEADLRQQYPGEAVVALAVLPEDGLAIARRRTAGSGEAATGAAELLTVGTGAKLPLAFPFPVKELVTHPGVHLTKVDEVPAGARLFGVLDESACHGAPECTGILAVDTLSRTITIDEAPIALTAGQLSLDATGLPMLPIRPVVAGTQLRGLDVSALVTFRRPIPIIDDKSQLASISSQQPSPADLLGAFSSTDASGSLTFFDAKRLTHYNYGDSRPVSATQSVRSAEPRVAFAVLEAADSTQLADYFVTPPSPLEVSTALGVSRDEIIAAIFQGEIFGLTGLPLAAGATSFTVPTAFASRAAVGDRLVITSGSETCELGVASVDATAGVVGADAPIPANCAAGGTFTVRAAGSQPFVIFAKGNDNDFDTVGSPGYVGRLGPGQSLVESTTPFYRATAAALSASISLRPEAGTGLARDASYVVRVESGFHPASSARAPSPVAGVAYGPPGAIAYVGTVTDPTAGGVDVNSYFVAYPGTSPEQVAEFASDAIDPLGSTVESAVFP